MAVRGAFGRACGLEPHSFDTRPTVFLCRPTPKLGVGPARAAELGDATLPRRRPARLFSATIAYCSSTTARMEIIQMVKDARFRAAATPPNHYFLHKTVPVLATCPLLFCGLGVRGTRAFSRTARARAVVGAGLLFFVVILASARWRLKIGPPSVGGIESRLLDQANRHSLVRCCLDHQNHHFSRNSYY